MVYLYMCHCLDCDLESQLEIDNMHKMFFIDTHLSLSSIHYDENTQKKNKVITKRIHFHESNVFSIFLDDVLCRTYTHSRSQSIIKVDRNIVNSLFSFYTFCLIIILLAVIISRQQMFLSCYLYALHVSPAISMSGLYTFNIDHILYIVFGGKKID